MIAPCCQARFTRVAQADQPPGHCRAGGHDERDGEDCTQASRQDREQGADQEERGEGAQTDGGQVVSGVGGIEHEELRRYDRDQQAGCQAQAGGEGQAIGDPGQDRPGSERG